MAAKGMCVLREIGVRIKATTTQATKAAVAARKPNRVSAAHRKAWANMPTATGHGNMRGGVEKKTLYAATATPAAVTSCHNGTALPTGSEGNAEQRQSQQQPRGDRDNDEPGIDQSSSAEPYPAVEEIEGAVEKMGAGHQDHARTNRDEAQRRAQVPADRHRADKPSESRRAERLQEEICTQPAQSAAHDRAGARADKYQYDGPDVLDAEDHRQCHCTCGGRERKKTGGRRRRSRDLVDLFFRDVRGQAASRDVLDRPHRRCHTLHFYARRCGHCSDRERGIVAVSHKFQFAPARYDRGAQPQRAAQALGRIYHLLGGLSVDVKSFGESENEISALVRRHGASGGPSCGQLDVCRVALGRAAAPRISGDIRPHHFLRVNNAIEFRLTHKPEL